MTPDLRDILDELRASQFSDIEGAEAAIVLPVSDQLVSRLIAQRLPRDAPIHEFELRADGDDVLSVSFRLRQPAFLPPFRIRLRIEHQPELPRSPVLVFRLLSQGLAALAGPAARLFAVLPPGVELDRDRVIVRLEELQLHPSWREVLSHLSVLEVHTVPRRLVLTVRGGLLGPVQVIAPARPSEA